MPFDILGKEIEGDLYTDKLRKIMLSTDAGLYSVEPAAVLYPKSAGDVVAAVKFAKKYGYTVHPRGTGSGLCGSAIGRGIIVDFSKYMNSLRSFNPDQMTFSCEPGYKYGELEQLLAGTGLFFPPAPSSGEYATFGGMYGTNAGGGYSVKYGNVADYLLDAEVVFADGSVRTLNDIAAIDPSQLPPAFKELYNEAQNNEKLIKDSYPSVPCNVCGYELRYLTVNKKLHLHKLLGGSEGTLGIVTRLTFRLMPKPVHSTLIVAYFDDIVSSAKAAQLAIPRNPAGIEIMDKSLIKIAQEHEPSLKNKLPQGYDNVLMIEFESDNLEEVQDITRKCMDDINAQRLAGEISLAVTEEEMGQFWAVRKAAVPILYLLKGSKKIIPLVEDAAIPTDRLVAYFNGLYSIFENHNVQFVIYGHIAKGLLHSRPLLDMKDANDIKLLKLIADDLYTLVKGLGGTVSGEHGDGRIRSCYIPLQYRDIYEIFLHVKKLLDPTDLFNPEIKTYNDPEQMMKDLRYGTDYQSHELENKLLIWEDGITTEIEKCHGCSKCTTVTIATRMCPMYKSTRDEISAPKAKANILRALISGRIDSRTIYEKAFQEIISRCVNCGSCSKECPSQVNIPKLALEAKNQYVKKFGMPFENKIVTNFEMFARYTRKLFPVITPIMKFKPMRKIAELTAGVSAERPFIKFAASSLYDRLAPTIGNGDKKALYFAGCYASYIRPEIGESTVRVLNHLGYQVLLPEQHCCGIPHISKGSAEGARHKIEDNLESWGSLIEEAEYIVASCSSCALSLVKEWRYCMGGELIDKVHAKTVHISQLIDRKTDELKLKAEGLSVAYHMACHMRLLPDSAASWRVLSAVDGMKSVSLKSSCCGMAGSWGLSAKNYEESVKIGSPMVISLLDSDCNICATDCPTCEMQLKHLSDKPVFHPVELVDRMLSK